ncbi:hypothetical protein Hgul01_00440 [Herpetosiphon gulosus]|uniref:Uncharacterized protein n=1 Tax=Herpetosiphon gulosus TaxID=1973496 RepID=A0ABP9WVR9_9CHLR
MFMPSPLAPSPAGEARGNPSIMKFEASLSRRSGRGVGGEGTKLDANLMNYFSRLV